MRKSEIRSSILFGLTPTLVYISAKYTPSGTGFVINGFSDSCTAETTRRIRYAFNFLGIECENCGIEVTITPTPTRGSHRGLDLAIAVAIADSISAFPSGVLEKLFLLGELGPNTHISYVSGVSSLLRASVGIDVETVIVHKRNAAEAVVTNTHHDVRIAEKLEDVFSFLNGNAELEIAKAEKFKPDNSTSDYDLKYLHVGDIARRAIEISAAGNHHIMISGPIGSGKTLLAKSLHSVLPLWTKEEAEEVSPIYSITGLSHNSLLRQGLIEKRPFRSPHYFATQSKILGGGRNVEPGEVSLSHLGVLLLEDIVEFSPKILPQLWNCVRDGESVITHSFNEAVFPANTLVIGTSNLCHCGKNGVVIIHDCVCSAHQILQYQKRLTSITDNGFEMSIMLPQLSGITECKSYEPSATVRKRVTSALDFKNERLRHGNPVPWSSNTGRVARTIADLAGSDIVRGEHTEEAELFCENAIGFEI